MEFNVENFNMNRAQINGTNKNDNFSIEKYQLNKMFR